MFGKQAAHSIASPMKDLKIKGGSFDMAGAAGVAGVAIGMLGSL
jgi:ethanolamine utilization microcompartment shell protein EutS